MVVEDQQPSLNQTFNETKKGNLKWKTKTKAVTINNNLHPSITPLTPWSQHRFTSVSTVNLLPAATLCSCCVLSPRTHTNGAMVHLSQKGEGVTHKYTPAPA